MNPTAGAIVGRVHSYISLFLLIALLGFGSSGLAENQCSYRPSAKLRMDGRANWNEDKAFFLAQSTQDPYWKKRWWLEKTIRVLRGGRGADANDDVDGLMKLSESDVIARLMNDLRFGDMVLDFNLAFLGYRPDSLWLNGTYAAEAVSLPNAVESARQVVQGGDYLKLLDLAAIGYTLPLDIEPSKDEIKSGQSKIEIFDARIAAVERFLRDTLASMQSSPPASVQTVCDAVTANLPLGLSFQSIIPLAWSLVLSDLEQHLPARLYFSCISGKDTLSPADFEKQIAQALQGTIQFAQQIRPFVEPSYAPRNVLDIRPFDPKTVGSQSSFNAYGANQRLLLVNSSTNMNRKRGAYILKHYFCDDLNPINTEDPGGHAGDRHGTQASCRACHYKLDPMAGFFRNYGSLFSDFSKSPKIFFDDGAELDLGQYTEAWKAPAGSGRVWNVGYVRSVSEEKYNDYGETLSDLHALLRREPEVKRCLMRRLFQYVVADDQPIDGGYLAYLSDEFTNRAQVNSSDAFKWAVSEVLTSQSFHQRDLDPNQCYDHAPGYDPLQAPPCRVAHILNQNCVKCHSSVTGNGHLNLSAWVDTAGGAKTFPHLDDKGLQIDLKTTMSQIVDRLSDPDELFRMPYMSYMNPQEREELYLWAQNQLTQSQTPAHKRGQP